MSKTNSFEQELHELIFQNTNIANIGDATGIRGDTTAGSLYIMLGNNVGDELSYTSYDRVAVARSAGGWTVASNNVSNTAAIEFPECTGGSETATSVVISAHATGLDGLMYYGDLDSDLEITTGITPQFLAGQLDVNED